MERSFGQVEMFCDCIIRWSNNYRGRALAIAQMAEQQQGGLKTRGTHSVGERLFLVRSFVTFLFVHIWYKPLTSADNEREKNLEIKALTSASRLCFFQPFLSDASIMVLIAAKEWRCFSWHLWCVLRSIGYDHIDSSVERLLHIHYAEQLAVMELFHLAIFVLMHIDDANAYVLGVWFGLKQNRLYFRVVWEMELHLVLSLRGLYFELCCSFVVTWYGWNCWKWRVKIDSVEFDLWSVTVAAEIRENRERALASFCHFLISGQAY